MQNIEAILSELGIEVPADKKADLTKKVAENYVTKNEHERSWGGPRLTGIPGRRRPRQRKPLCKALRALTLKP